HVKIVQELITHKDLLDLIASDNNIALKIAIENRHFKIAKILLEIEAVKKSVHVNDNLVLRNALKFGHPQNEDTLPVVNILLDIENVRNEAGASKNEALVLAASNGHLQVVIRLLQIDDVVKNNDSTNFKALTEAANWGHTEIVKKLLEIYE